MPSLRVLILSFLLVLMLWLVYRLIQAILKFFIPYLGNFLRKYWRLWCVNPILNPICEALNLSPICILPEGEAGETPRKWVLQSQRLIHQSADALKHTARFSQEKKKALRRQMLKVPANLVSLSWKLERLHHLQHSFEDDSKGIKEIEAMSQHLLQEMEKSVHVLQTVSLALFKLELACEEPAIEELLQEMQRANRRMRILAESHQRKTDAFLDED